MLFHEGLIKGISKVVSSSKWCSFLKFGDGVGTKPLEFKK